MYKGVLMTLKHQQGLFPISTVSNLTGVNSVTLRAWERRYGLIKPSRTESGHRLYSDKDIEQIRLILGLLDEGVAISRVKEALKISSTEIHADSENLSFWNKYQDEMLRGVHIFDVGLLDATYHEVLSLYPVDVVTKKLLLPLLEKLGQRWMNISTGVAEEHFFSSFLRNRLGARFHHRNKLSTGSLLVTACVEGEQHEFGLLLFSLSAHSLGYRLILLGANTPILQLAEVVHRSNSDGIVLSVTIEPENPRFINELKKLVDDTHVPVWVGVRTSENLRHQIEATGAIAVGQDLVVGLHIIHKTLINK